METNTLQPQQENAIAIITKDSGLDKSKQDYITQKFNEFIAIADEWGSKARSIVVTDASQVDVIQMARSGRLLLKQKRVDIEKTRKQLKEASLQEGRTIDKIASALTALIEPLEKHLDDQEKFAERQLESKRAELRVARADEIKPYAEFLIPGTDLGALDEETYSKTFQFCKFQFDEREKQRAADEQKRISDAKIAEEERERVKKENEELRAANLKKEQELQRQRDENNAKLKELEERDKKEREKNVAKLKKEREEKERLEKEIQDKKDEEARQLAEKKKAERAAKLAPDKDKLVALVKQLSELTMPSMKSEEGRRVLNWIIGGISTAIEIANEKIESL